MDRCLVVTTPGPAINNLKAEDNCKWSALGPSAGSRVPNCKKMIAKFYRYAFACMQELLGISEQSSS